MTLTFQILGEPGRDNAVLVRLDSGQKVDRLLFDCGEGCLGSLPVSEIQSIDHVLFSHFHMDHISGFDSFFRLTYDSTHHLWGPPGAGDIMQHRFRGFLWNLYQHLTSQWFVHDIHPDRIECTRYDAGEAFAVPYTQTTPSLTGCFIDTPAYQVEACTMNHQSPSMAYIVREKARLNVNTERMAAMGLRSGMWVRQVKDPQMADSTVVEVDGQPHTLGDLRQQLLYETPGQSLAYLTDFLMDTAAQERLIPLLQGCTWMICESQYRQDDAELALRNYHMTAMQAAETAKQAGVNELILFHVSDRYDSLQWLELLEEARSIFPNTRFPDGWLV